MLLAATEISKLAFDDGLPPDDDGEDDFEDILLDRKDWTIILILKVKLDAVVAVNGDVPEYIIDGILNQLFFCKTG